MLSQPINGFDMHYVEAGHGPAVVLVHGSFTDFRFWELQTAALRAHFHVTAVSMRPYWPNGQPTAKGEFSVPRYVDDVAAFLDKLDVGPVHLVGHSLGAHVALRVARAVPSLVRTLVLAEPGGPLAADLRPQPAASSSPPNPMVEAGRLIENGDIEGGLTKIIESATRPGYWESCPAFFKTTARDNASTLIAQAVENRPPITRADIGAIKQPVLLIGGADSPAPFSMTLDVLEENLTDVTRVRIPAGTHLMNLQHPADFNAAVLAFLSRHGPLARSAA